MRSELFYQRLSSYLKEHKKPEASSVLMGEIGRIISNHKEDFIRVLDSANIWHSSNPSDAELVDAFIKNADTNKKLLAATSFLVSHHNKISDFSGGERHSKSGMSAINKLMQSQFCGDDDKYSGANGINVVTNKKNYMDRRIKKSSSNHTSYFDDNYSFEDQSNAGGIFGSIIGGGLKLANGIVKGQHDKKYGATDSAMSIIKSKQDAQAQLVASITQQRQQQLAIQQQKAKVSARNKKVALIIGGSLLGVGLIVLGIYIYKRKK